MCRTFLIYTASTQKYLIYLPWSMNFPVLTLHPLRASWSSNSSRLDCNSCKLKGVFCLLVCFQMVMNSLGHPVELIRRKWETDFEFCRSLLVSLASVFLRCPLVTKSFQMDSDHISYLRAGHFEQKIKPFSFYISFSSFISRINLHNNTSTIKLFLFDLYFLGLRIEK